MNGEIAFGNISNEQALYENLAENAIPTDVVEMDVDDYDEFLIKRRLMMAEYIEKYFKSL